MPFVDVQGVLIKLPDNLLGDLAAKGPLTAIPVPPDPPEERSKTEQFLGDWIVALKTDFQDTVAKLEKEIGDLRARCDTGHQTRMELIEDVRGLIRRGAVASAYQKELQDCVKTLTERCDQADELRINLTSVVGDLQSDFDVLRGVVSAQGEKVESGGKTGDWYTALEAIETDRTKLIDRLCHLEAESCRHNQSLEHVTGYLSAGGSAGRNALDGGDDKEEGQ